MMVEVTAEKPRKIADDVAGRETRLFCCKPARNT
jgi:hypothetical protein